MNEESDNFYEDSDEYSEDEIQKSSLKITNDKEFKEKLQELLKNEKQFISILQEVLDTHFIKVYKEMVEYPILKSVFGDLEYFLELHTRMLEEFEQSSSAYEVCTNFIIYERELRKHIEDQWKTCEDEDWYTLRNYLKDIDFYNKSSWIILTYANFVRSINNDQFVAKENRLECEKAFKILIDIYRQINYIQEGLKLIVGSNIDIRDCGSVMYKNQFEVKAHSGISFTRKHNFDVFITEKYAIFTEPKSTGADHFYEFIDAFLLTQIIVEKDEVNKKISILTGESRKKKFTLYTHNTEKFQKTFNYLRQDYDK